MGNGPRQRPLPLSLFSLSGGSSAFNCAHRASTAHNVAICLFLCAGSASIEGRRTARSLLLVCALREHRTNTDALRPSHLRQLLKIVHERLHPAGGLPPVEVFVRCVVAVLGLCGVGSCNHTFTSYADTSTGDLSVNLAGFDTKNALRTQRRPLAKDRRQRRRRGTG